MISLLLLLPITIILVADQTEAHKLDQTYHVKYYNQYGKTHGICASNRVSTYTQILDSDYQVIKDEQRSSLCHVPMYNIVSGLKVLGGNYIFTLENNIFYYKDTWVGYNFSNVFYNFRLSKTINNPNCNIYINFDNQDYLVSAGQQDQKKTDLSFNMNVNSEKLKGWLHFYIYSKCNSTDYSFDWGVNSINMLGSYGCIDYMKGRGISSDGNDQLMSYCTCSSDKDSWYGRDGYCHTNKNRCSKVQDLYYHDRIVQKKCLECRSNYTMHNGGGGVCKLKAINQQLLLFNPSLDCQLLNQTINCSQSMISGQLQINNQPSSNNNNNHMKLYTINPQKIRIGITGEQSRHYYRHLELNNSSGAGLIMRTTFMDVNHQYHIEIGQSISVIIQLTVKVNKQTRMDRKYEQQIEHLHGKSDKYVQKQFEQIIDVNWKQGDQVDIWVIIHKSQLRLVYLDFFARKVTVKGCRHQLINNCVDCDANLILHNNQCIDKCPSNTYYYHNNPNNSNRTSCMQKCPQSTYLFNETECRTKVNNCKLQKQDNQCIKCEDGYYLNSNQNQCYMNYNYLQNGKAQNCSQYCIRCESQNECIECEGDKYYHNGNCILSECYFNQYYDTSSQKCLDCDRLCQKCKGPSSNDCTSCYETMKFRDNSCSCEVDSFLVFNANPRCQKCKKGCIECSSDNRCLRCNSTRVLRDGECDCLSGQILNTTDNECKPASSYVDQYYKDLKETPKLANIMKNPEFMNVQTNKYQEEQKDIQKNNKHSLYLNLLAFASLFFGNSVSRNCLFNIQLVTCLSFMQFLSKDQLGFYQTDWSFMIPMLRNDSFISTSSTLIMIGIQLFTFLVSIVVYVFTRDSVNKNGQSEDKKTQNSGNNEDENIDLDLEDRQTNQNIRADKIKKLARQIFCWNFPLYFQIVFLVPSMYLLSFYWISSMKDENKTVKTMIIFYFLFQILFFIYLNVRLIIQDRQISEEYYVLVGQYNWMQKSSRFYNCYEILKYLTFFLLLVNLEYSFSISILIALCVLQLICSTIFNPFVDSSIQFIQIYQLVIQIAFYCYIICRYDDTSSTENKNQMLLASRIYVYLNIMVILLEMVTSMFTKAKYFYYKKQKLIEQQKKKVSISFIMDTKDNNTKDDNANTKADKEEELNRSQNSNDCQIEWLQAILLNDVQTQGFNRIYLQKGSQIMVGRMEDVVVQIEWEGNEIMLDESEFEYVDNSSGNNQQSKGQKVCLEKQSVGKIDLQLK